MSGQAVRKYKEAWEARERERYSHAEKLRKKALREAERAVGILASEYGIKKAIVFGSVLEQGEFLEGSDIDIAVEGLNAGQFFEAYGRLMMELNFHIDLKPFESLKGLIRERVKKGKVLYEI